MKTKQVPTANERDEILDENSTTKEYSLAATHINQKEEQSNFEQPGLQTELASEQFISLQIESVQSEIEIVQKSLRNQSELLVQEIAEVKKSLSSQSEVQSQQAVQIAQFFKNGSENSEMLSNIVLSQRRLTQLFESKFSDLALQVQQIQENVEVLNKRTIKIDQIYRLLESLKGDAEPIGEPVSLTGSDSKESKQISSDSPRKVYLYRSNTASSNFPGLEKLLENKMNEYLSANPVVVKGYFTNRKTVHSVALQTITSTSRSQKDAPVAIFYVAYSAGSRLDLDKIRLEVDSLEREFGSPTKLFVLRYGDNVPMLELKQWKGESYQVQYTSKGLVEKSLYTETELNKLFEWIHSRVSDPK